MGNEPSPLQVMNDNHWEEISCYIMSWLILTRYKAQVSFQPYGRNGQAQHGVDVLTIDNRFSSILGQAKYKSPGHALELKDVLETLDKTSTYPNKLEHLVLLTNGIRNTKVDDLLVECGGRHTNNNNATFTFEVIYWQDITTFNFIPHQELVRFFPALSQIAERLVQDPYEKALREARIQIPRYLTEQDMDQVRSWARLREIPNDNLDLKIIILLQGLQKAKVLAQHENIFGADADAIKLRPIVIIADRLYQALIEYRPSYTSLVPESDLKAWNNYARAAKELEDAYNQIMRESF